VKKFGEERQRKGWEEKGASMLGAIRPFPPGRRGGKKKRKGGGQFGIRVGGERKKKGREEVGFESTTHRHSGLLSSQRRANRRGRGRKGRKERVNRRGRRQCKKGKK